MPRKIWKSLFLNIYLKFRSKTLLLNFPCEKFSVITIPLPQSDYLKTHKNGSNHLLKLRGGKLLAAEILSVFKIPGQ